MNVDQKEGRKEETVSPCSGCCLIFHVKELGEIPGQLVPGWCSNHVSVDALPPKTLSR